MKKIIFILLIATIFVTGFTSEQKKKEGSDLNVTAAKLSKMETGNKKENFTKSMAAIIDSVKSEIRDNKTKVETLSKKDNLTPEEQNFMQNLFTRYHIKNENYKELLNKMVLPPTSLILAQASLESGWGKSNLAQDGNNLFGMKSFDKDEPRIEKGGLQYRKYDTLKDSVQDYIINLSRHNSYETLRSAIRKGDSSHELTKHLAAYCEDPEYGKNLVTMIDNNDFTQYDF